MATMNKRKDPGSSTVKNLEGLFVAFVTVTKYPKQWNSLFKKEVYLTHTLGANGMYLLMDFFLQNSEMFYNNLIKFPPC